MVDFGFKVGGDVTMGFKPGGSVTFGFDVGGSYVPPEPEPGGGFGVLGGSMVLACSGNLAEVADMEIISGIATLLEE